MNYRFTPPGWWFQASPEFSLTPPLQRSHRPGHAGPAAAPPVTAGPEAAAPRLAAGQVSAADADRRDGRHQEEHRDAGGDQEGPVEAGGQGMLVGRRHAAGEEAAREPAALRALVSDHRPGHAAQHRQADGATHLPAGVEQAGRRPGVRIGDAGQGDQWQRDEQQAQPGPGDQGRAEQPAQVACCAPSSATASTGRRR